MAAKCVGLVILAAACGSDGSSDVHERCVGDAPECQCEPFSRDLPFRIDATMTAIGMEWVTTTGSEYVRLATDGQVVAQIPLPGLGEPTDGQPRLAWNGDALAYVGGDETGAYLAMVDPDGANWRRGPSDASGPLATDGRIVDGVAGGFRAAYRVASNSTVVFATGDGNGAWTDTRKMPVPGEPLALTSLAQAPVAVWVQHDGALGGDAGVIGVLWQQDGGFGVPGPTLAAHAVMTAHDDSTVAVVAMNELFHYAGAGAQALDVPQVIGVARSDAWEIVQVGNTGAHRKRLDADFVESSSELLRDGVTSTETARMAIGVAGRRILFAFYDVAGTTTHLEQRCLPRFVP